jgi:hypothetical protein
MHMDEFNSDDHFKYQFTPEDVKLFDERREKRLSGESLTYNWNEAKEIITKKKSNNHDERRQIHPRRDSSNIN